MVYILNINASYTILSKERKSMTELLKLNHNKVTLLNYVILLQIKSLQEKLNVTIKLHL